MQNALRRFAAYLWENVGNCSICIRSAFQAAAATWILTLLFSLLNWSAFFLLTFLLAVALTSLWMAHLLVYAQKVASIADHVTRAEVSRRAMLPLFVRTLGAATVFSITPTFAQINPCTAGTGSCGQLSGDMNCPDCYRPCYNGPSPCIRCRSCGPTCGDNVC
jgi:hypothetical protein